MTKAEQKLHAQAEKLRNQLADAEAGVAHLKAKLTRIEAKLTGEPPAATGLDMLWKAAMPIARLRSSKLQCRQEWNRIPAHERPPLKTILDALHTWNRCPEWKKDGNQFVPGLHRWIKLRQWENLPESAAPKSPYRQSAKPDPAKTPGEQLSDEELAAAMETLRANIRSAGISTPA